MSGEPLAVAGPALEVRREEGRPHDWRGGALGSLVIHLLVLALLSIGLRFTSGGAARQALDTTDVIHGVLIMPAPQPEPEAQPEPAPPPPVLAQDRPKPDAVLRKEEVAPKPAVQKPPVKPATKAQPAAQAPAASAPTRSDAQSDSDSDSELGLYLQSVRENWLEPPRVRRDFRCRLRVDYKPGGIVVGVVVTNGCGEALLDDSVERAIWKTQPLPIAASRTQAGSVYLDFSP